MRSEAQYQPGQSVTFVMPRQPNDRFAPEAAKSVLGLRPPLVQPDGIRYSTEVIAAEMHGHDLHITLLVGEPE